MKNAESTTPIQINRVIFMLRFGPQWSVKIPNTTEPKIAVVCATMKNIITSTGVNPSVPRA